VVWLVWNEGLNHHKEGGVVGLRTSKLSAAREATRGRRLNFVLFLFVCLLCVYMQGFSNTQVWGRHMDIGAWRRKQYER
jgi:hypothetical protein